MQIDLRLSEKDLIRTNLPYRYWKTSPSEIYDQQNYTKVLEGIRKFYQSTYEEKIKSSFSILSDPHDLDKNLIASVLTRYVTAIGKGHAFYFKFTEYEQMKESPTILDAEFPNYTTFSAMRSSNFLVIDDLGFELTSTSWKNQTMNQCLFSLLMYRFENLKQTVLMTSYDLESFLNLYKGTPLPRFILRNYVPVELRNIETEK
jgi:hypothetical protein